MKMKFVAGLFLFAGLAFGHRLNACGDAGGLRTANLPSVIKVRVDPRIKYETADALNYWEGVLGIKFEITNSQDDCMIYVHRTIRQLIPGMMGQIADQDTAGITQLPIGQNFDGVAYILDTNTKVVAHEIGHILGFVHARTGLMNINAPEWGVNSAQVQNARLIRLQAQETAHQ